MMDNTIHTTTAIQSRDRVASELSTSWGHEIPVSMTESGALYLSMDETPVLCRFNTAPLGHVIVEIESPILLDIMPPPEFYELIAAEQLNLAFGSLAVFGGQEPGQVMVTVNAKLFADGLTGTHLKRAILLVHRAALALIDIFARLTPPIGGRRAYV